MKVLDYSLTEWTKWGNSETVHAFYRRNIDFDYYNPSVGYAEVLLDASVFGYDVLVRFFGDFSWMGKIYDSMFENTSKKSLNELKNQVDNFLIKMDKLKSIA